MPRGGNRVGSGRKPRLGPTDRDLTQPAAVAMPAELSDAERRLWREMAPAAITLQTLRQETLTGFVLLLQTVAARDEAAARIATDGLVTPDGRPHPLLTHSRQLAQRAESLLARYGLAAQGRPVEVPRAPEPDDLTKWERLTMRPDDPRYDFYSTPTVRRG